MESQGKWAIDIDWLEANHRSFSIMVAHYLCAKCRKKLKTESNIPSSEEILKNLKSCCSKGDTFINERMPIQESVFRVILAGGNRPMSIEEISRELDIRRKTDTYRTSPTLLLRLLKNSPHYGFRQTK